MPTPEPSLRIAAIDAAPWLLLSSGVFAAATQAISVARSRGETLVDMPPLADFGLVRAAASSPTAWLVACICAAAIAAGIARRSHVEPAVGLLVGVALVYFHVMDTWLEPVTGIFDARLISAVMWLYMPQSLAMACFAAHGAIGYRRARP